MKKKEQECKNRIWKYVVLACVLLVAGISVFAGGYLRFSDKNADRQSEKGSNAQADVLTKEAGAVMAERAQKNNVFEDISGDSREVIRIVEVIPHDVCSIFPYLVEWGSKEEYDRNTPLGYEGIRYLSCNLDRTFFGNKKIFNYVYRGIKEACLDDYNVQFATQPTEWSEKWWRETKINEKITGVNGYFEFVGEGKGLYCIDLDTIVNENAVDYGIRYKVQAMERNSDTKKGEWEVDGARYFWAGKKETENYPTDDIGQQTGYNYDLKFSTKDNNNRVYMVKSVLTNLSESASDNQKCDYAAKIVIPDSDTDTTWTYGYQYQKNGNYIVCEVKSANANTKAGDKYVRIENSQKDDGKVEGKPGYFRLYNDKLDQQREVYQVTFKFDNSGNYILDPAAVQSELNMTDSTLAPYIIFDYAGENKGNYDVVFQYAGDQQGTYSCEIIRVSDGDGRYALTSTVKDINDLYKWVGKERGDYSKVVTKVDCLGIDYDTNNAGWRGNGELPKGVCIGRTDIWGNEYGAWVFHAVRSDEKNGLTKLNSEGKLDIDNNRIYVYAQSRKNRYYERNGFKNNEWFKLLIYLEDSTKTKGLATDAYANSAWDWNVTGQDIVSKYSDELNVFNTKYRIEIIQRTPGELTVDEVRKADFIYIAEEAALTISKKHWEQIDTALGGKLDDYPENMAFTDDFSDAVLLELYANCLYHEEGKTATTALMLDVPHLRNHCTTIEIGDTKVIEATSNLGKFYFLVDLFDDPAYFANFIGDYGEQGEQHSYSEHKAHINDGYTTILSNGNVKLYPNKDGNGDTFYNWGRTYVVDGKEVPSREEETWNYEYFAIFDKTKNQDGTITGNKEISLNGATNSFTQDGPSIYKQSVKSGWTWYAPDSISTSFTEFDKMLNIWKIMHNKTSKKSSSPKVIVTNADYSIIQGNKVTGNTYYIYVDEYQALESDAFLIKYQAEWTPIEVTNPTPLSSLSITRLADGKELINDTSPQYGTEYQYDAFGDFMNEKGQLNGVKSVGYQIIAKDKANKASSAVVWIIMREAFMLN